MRRKFQDFMAGRYGTDELTRFMMWICVACLILNMITRWKVFDGLALLILVLSYVRIFSRNYSKRNAENQKYLNAARDLRMRFEKMKNKAAQSREFHIYKCPSCGQKIRIPRGKGKICITCPKCRTEFTKKS